MLPTCRSPHQEELAMRSSVILVIFLLSNTTAGSNCPQIPNCSCSWTSGRQVMHEPFQRSCRYIMYTHKSRKLIMFNRCCIAPAWMCFQHYLLNRCPLQGWRSWWWRRATSPQCGRRSFTTSRSFIIECFSIQKTIFSFPSFLNNSEDI